jgi:predicted ATPase/DNA-binding NarL/FixJ family response regulator
MIGQLATNLPAPRTSLVGREGDVAELRSLLLDGQERLVTLTGVGGCGKTRLALQVASELQGAFPDGVYLAELAPLSDPRLVPEAVSSALGIPEAQANEPLDALAASLQGRTLLLLLDNCEHLIEASASLADRLLSACPGLRILATSREPLQVSGESQRRVLPLAAPDPGQASPLEELLLYPAVQLFVERAAAAQPGFRLTPENADAVARVCSLLAGIPLAIELAAARVRVLSVGQIAGRLDDCFKLLVGSSRSAPTRQQTLRATLDWSYGLLSPPEQAAFRRLALFAGGFGVEAAEAVCPGDELGEGEVLDLLARLVDRSLLLVEEQAGEARYRLLEPVRQYGMRLLEESGDLEIARDRVAAHCIALAERAEPELHGPGQAEWLRRLDAELDNIRAVIARAEERGDAETSLRLAGALHWYFWMRRHLREGQRCFEPALNRDAAVPPGLRAKGLFGTTLMLALLGEYPKALPLGWDALALYREVGDSEGLALTTIILSHITLAMGDLPATRSFAEEAMIFARETGSRWQFAHALVLLGQAAHQEGDTAQALTHHEQALTLFRSCGDSWGVSYTMANLASLQQSRADVVRASALSTVQFYWEQGDHRSLASALEYLARRGETGHPEVQVRLFAAAHSLRKSIGAQAPAGERDDVERHLAAARAQLGEARFAATWAEGCAMSLEQVVSTLDADRPAPGPAPAAPRKRGLGPSDELTRREREVALLLARGHTDRQIAEELTITEGTAGIHVHHILEKLGFRSRVQVAGWALAQGLIETRPE